MSLDWNIKEVADYDNVCFVGDGDERRLSAITESLIWRTMVVGLNEISEANFREFAYRLNFYERLFGETIMEEGKKRFITLAEMRAHIGLRTNANRLTRAQWMKNIKNSIEQEFGWQANAWYRNQEAQLKVIEEAESILNG